MRNKKSPAMMIVAAVLILGFAFFLNATSFFTRPLLPEAPPEQKQPETKMTANDSRSMLANSLRSKTDGRTLVAGENPLPEGIPKEPAILKPKVERYEQKPNPTSTSARWWDEDNNVQKQSEETREKRGF